MFRKINKKGMFYEPILILFALIILTTSFYNIITNQGKTIDIGKTSADLVNLDKEIKFRLDNIEHSSLYYIYNSIIQLSQNSGYLENQLKECVSWNSNCKINKDILIKNLKIYLQNNFNELARYQNLNDYTIDIKEQNNKLIFSFTSPNTKIKKENIEYTINHNFQKEVIYDLNKFEELYNNYSKIHSLKNCQDKDPASKEVKEILEPGLTCNEKEDNDQYLYFEYNQDKFYFSNSLNSLEYPIQPVIRFKLNKYLTINPEIS